MAPTPTARPARAHCAACGAFPGEMHVCPFTPGELAGLAYDAAVNPRVTPAESKRAATIAALAFAETEGN